MGDPDEKSGPDTPRELKARALRLLMRRDHGRAELVRKLTQHAESTEAVELLLDELVRRKLLSEDRVAESRANTLSRKFGVSRIRHDLRAKGIAGETIERVAAEAQSTEVERAREIWKRKFREPAASRADRAKQMRFLAARGFSHDTIRKVMSGDEATNSDSPEEV
jgi:regulatory protein